VFPLVKLSPIMPAAMTSHGYLPAITPATATLALATLGDKTNNRIISIDQGKLIRCDIALNIANVNDP